MTVEIIGDSTVSCRPLRGQVRGVVEIGAAINPGNSGGLGMRATR